MRLNLGCGTALKDGYLNIDCRAIPGALIGDATSFDFIPPGTVDEILAEHVLEHICPTKTVTVLSFWRSLLKPSGKLVLKVPDLERCLEAFLARSHRERYAYPGLIRYIYGRPWYEGGTHLTGFTAERLFDVLGDAMFREIEVDKGTWKGVPELVATAWFRQS